MSKIRTLVLVTTAIVTVTACAVADPRPVVPTGTRYSTDQATFELQQLVTDLVHPWGFAFLPDGSILITERAGRLFLFSDGDVVEVAGLPQIDPNGQGGLLDIVLDPEYTSNGWIYLSYSMRYGGGFGTVVARARLNGTTLIDVQEVFRMNNPSGGGQHFGSRLVFDRDGFLYVTIGDRGQPPRSQDPGDHAGSLIRVLPDGSVPSSNPFADGGEGAPEVFSYGHRNPQGIALHPETGVVWLHEHGPQGGDEVNIVSAGQNHGWPTITYGVNYVTGTRIGIGTSAPGMEQPIIYWSPSIAPSGMAFYTGGVFPQWEGDLFVGALAGQHVRRLELDGESVVAEEEILQGVIGRVRDVRVGPDGALYLLTDASSGSLYRLVPAE